MNQSVGCRRVELSDAVQDVMIPLTFLYPARQAPQIERFGPYALNVALNAAPVGARLPLIVLSHGNGGTPWAYSD